MFIPIYTYWQTFIYENINTYKHMYLNTFYVYASLKVYVWVCYFVEVLYPVVYKTIPFSIIFLVP